MAHAIAGARHAGDQPFGIHAEHESKMRNTHDLVAKLMTLTLFLQSLEHRDRQDGHRGKAASHFQRRRSCATL